jgi:hypothetical protein
MKRLRNLEYYTMRQFVIYTSRTDCQTMKQNYDGLECNSNGETEIQTECWGHFFDGDIIE